MKAPAEGPGSIHVTWVDCAVAKLRRSEKERVTSESIVAGDMVSKADWMRLWTEAKHCVYRLRSKSNKRDGNWTAI